MNLCPFLLNNSWSTVHGCHWRILLFAYIVKETDWCSFIQVIKSHGPLTLVSVLGLYALRFQSPSLSLAQNVPPLSVLAPKTKQLMNVPFLSNPDTITCHQLICCCLLLLYSSTSLSSFISQHQISACIKSYFFSIIKTVSTKSFFFLRTC